jgi:hypothetical protein
MGAGAQVPRLVDRDDTQPGEGCGRIGRTAKHDRPGGLAGVFDDFLWRVNGDGDRSQQTVVVSAVELGLVAARRCGG